MLCDMLLIFLCIGVFRIENEERAKQGTLYVMLSIWMYMGLQNSTYNDEDLAIRD